ncbi:right-handed parallel beta-helix repeat-containing protein [Dysgonomonas reticulitermitis]
MKLYIKYLFFVTCFLFGEMSGFAQSFIHPGIDMNKQDLEYMRGQVLEEKEPWKKSFDFLKENVPSDFQFTSYAHVISGPFAKPDVGGNELSRCSRMAYSYAVLWYITKDESYARKAIEIIDGWSSKLRSFDENNAKLLVALTGYEFCNAAEILRYSYPGWTEKNTESMTHLMMSVYFPVIRYYFADANGNWDGAIMHTLISIAVFTDNKELFDNVVYHYLHAPANGSLVKYIYPSGQCQETCRDQGHVQMGLYEFFGTARIAHTQGVDLLSAADNRLALGLEYTAKWVIGGDVFAYGVPAERERYRYRGGFEFCLDYYTSKGIDMPNLRELISRTTVNRLDNALWKLTSYCVKLYKTTPALQELKPSRIAYMAGAKGQSEPNTMKDVVIIQTNQDLQSVLNSHAGSGKTLLLRKGEYRLKESLMIPSGIHLRGEGLNTVLICESAVRTAAIMLKDLDAHDITIENLVLDGAWEHDAGSDPNTGRFQRTGRLSNTLTGISFRGEAGHDLRNVIFKDLTVINFSRSGVYLSDVQGVEIDRCNFSDNGSHVVPGPRLQHNLLIHHSQGIRIRNSRFDTSLRGCGILAEHCQNIYIEACEVARNGWHGIMMAECQDGVTEGCLIEGNDGCGFYGDYFYSGSKNLSVKNNKIQYNNEYAVKCFAVTGLSIGNNVYRWNGAEDKQEYVSSRKKLQLENLYSDK